MCGVGKWKYLAKGRISSLQTGLPGQVIKYIKIFLTNKYRLGKYIKYCGAGLI